VIYERNPRLGIKILISGGGKCNITHDAPPREIEKGFIPAEARFLRYALHELTAEQVLADLGRQGVETYTRPNGRVFPLSGRSEDVLAAFERMLAEAGAEIRTGAPVTGIQITEGRATGLYVNDQLHRADAIIVATGGMSYRKVGTTGDGIRWGGDLGHTIVPVRAALAPIYFDHPPPADWQGVALRDVRFWIEVDGHQPAPSRELPYDTEHRDDLLLTHRGLSGPAALEVSRAAAFYRESASRIDLVVDLLPDRSAGELQELWNRRVSESGRSEVQTFVDMQVPKALTPYLLNAAGVPGGTKLSSMTREWRASLLATLKHWKPGRLGEVPIDRGEVTAGGIALAEVSPTTMESKLVPGLYFAGEALDISGDIGGYNLQAAFATGHVAGRSAGTEHRKHS
jgi:predicted Rossmann fold flavoprotein